MEETTGNAGDAFEFLEGQPLCAVTFIWDYYQVLIGTDGLSIYSHPQVDMDGRRISQVDSGYRDVLCSLIGHKVRKAVSDDTELVISFDNEVRMIISFRSGDRIGGGPESLVAGNAQGNILVVGDSVAG